ncbi:type IV secretory system conjugative DNA transfer family protein [Bradyrhizobium sp. WSM2254]|uniref:type IV secretory system conjugative DNA transfer family protein n=1 Tax=Bradyrhizobium sp. WSM2254 TaxID=1188263 RepID=UPI00042549CD|nr:type IV secretory system conjugative DNA transfer family protein [Bradyrhizobium sp. WSM2254]
MSVHGTARFADRDELRKAKLVRDRPPGDLPEGLMVGWWFEDQYDFTPIEYSGDLHQLIVGGTGGGKFTTAIAPMLLGSRLGTSTVVVVDPKGEIAKLVGPYFETPFGSKPTVHLLDPWDQCGTGQTSALNVLDHISESNPNHVDDARALADAMIIPSGGENTHWDNAARNFLTAILLYVALSPKEKDHRSLLRVRELVSMTWAMPKSYTGPKRQTLSAILIELLDSDLGDGAIKRGVSSLFNREDKERSGIISSIDRDTSWIDSPQMKKVLQGDGLDLNEAARGGHKYFVVLPPEFFMTHRAWLRLMVTTFAKAFKRTTSGGMLSNSPRWRHIVIDEFANLGEMSFILNDIAVARGYNVKYHLAIQDLSQLARVYTQGWESFINNSFQRFFAVSDMFTAEYVSRMLGGATVQSTSTNIGSSGSRSYGDSFGTNRGESRSSSATGSGGSSSTSHGRSHTLSYNESSGWSRGQSTTPTQRALQTPDEVRRLPEDWQFVFFRGLHPVQCWRPAYWEIFPSLPNFSLKEVLGTIGRKPKDDEFAYFNRWVAGTLLMKPKARPEVPKPLPPEPKAIPAPEPAKPLDYRIKLAMGCAALAFLWWLMPDRPAPPANAPAPAVIVRNEPPTRPPEPKAPPAPIRTRAPVPNDDAMRFMPAGAVNRDFIIGLMDKNVALCAPGHGQDELKLMDSLAFWAKSKRVDTTVDAAFAADHREQEAGGRGTVSADIASLEDHGKH